jgi:Na+-driven multidrug efflux pump
MGIMKVKPSQISDLLTVVAIPFGLLVGFKLNWGLHGLWLGVSLSRTLTKQADKFYSLP